MGLVKGSTVYAHNSAYNLHPCTSTRRPPRLIDEHIEKIFASVIIAQYTLHIQQL